MANVIEIAKASITAYNDKDWSKAKDMLAADPRRWRDRRGVAGLGQGHP